MTLLFYLKSNGGMPPSPTLPAFSGNKKRKKRLRTNFKTIQEIKEDRILKNKEEEELILMLLTEFDD